MTQDIDILFSTIEAGNLEASILQEEFNAGEITKQEFYQRLADITANTYVKTKEVMAKNR